MSKKILHQKLQSTRRAKRCSSIQLGKPSRTALLRLTVIGIRIRGCSDVRIFWYLVSLECPLNINPIFAFVMQFSQVV